MYPAHYRMNWLPVGKLLDVEKSVYYTRMGTAEKNDNAPGKCIPHPRKKVRPCLQTLLHAVFHR